MGRRRNANNGAPPAGGILLFKQPVGPTSMQVITKLRRLFGIRKAGHCGTLDPFADGVLPIAFGRATKMIRYMDNYDKAYRVLIHLGEATDTQDLSGRVIGGQRPSPESCAAFAADDYAVLKEAIAKLSGSIQQQTPMYSAAKVKGKAMYRYAREGKAVEGKMRTVEISGAKLVAAGSLPEAEQDKVLKRSDLPAAEYFPGLEEEHKGFDTPCEVKKPPFWLVVDIACSKGTYIRTWAHDLGKILGTGAYAARLRRLRSGPYTFAEAVSADTLEKYKEEGCSFEKADGSLPFYRPPETARPDFPVIELDKTDARRFIRGQGVSAAREASEEERFRVYCEDLFLGIGRLKPSFGPGIISAERMFIDIENFTCRFKQEF